MKISNRLKSVAGLITKNDNVIDIGCDHALLDIYLIQNNIVDHIIASDISENALKNGIKNIEKYNLKDKIEAKVGNGLECISKKTNTAVISGMGANTIIKILSNPNIKQIKKIIVQSNNDYYLLRKYISKKGYKITHESVVYDKSKYYINIVFEKGIKKYSHKELKYGPILMKSNKEYYNYLLKKEKQILENIPKHHIIRIIQIRKDIIYLNKLLKNI